MNHEMYLAMIRRLIGTAWWAIGIRTDRPYHPNLKEQCRWWSLPQAYQPWFLLPCVAYHLQGHRITEEGCGEVIRLGK